MANLTLPVYKADPEPLEDLSWNNEQLLLTWNYNSSWAPSGFVLSFCGDDTLEECTVVETGPLDRRYHVRIYVEFFK